MQPTGEDTLRTFADEGRLAEVLAADPSLRAALPVPATGTVIRDASTPLHRQIEAVLTAYADRPALADRAAEPVPDPATGRTTLLLLPRYDAITYREVRDRVAAIAADWHEHGLKPGDIVCTLGFTSTDYTGYTPDVNSNGANNVDSGSLATSSEIGLGTDFYAYPQPRTWTFGIQAGW